MSFPPQRRRAREHKLCNLKAKLQGQGARARSLCCTTNTHRAVSNMCRAGHTQLGKLTFARIIVARAPPVDKPHLQSPDLPFTISPMPRCAREEAL